jgi:hypothetical protein
MPRLTNLRLTGVALSLAIALALLSVYLCGPSAADPCYQPVLKGGFPIAYLFDAPGVSRERQLAFVEDQLSSSALVLDIAIYFAIVLFAMLAVSRRRSARMQAGSRG